MEHIFQSLDLAPKLLLKFHQQLFRQFRKRRSAPQHQAAEA